MSTVDDATIPAAANVSIDTQNPLNDEQTFAMSPSKVLTSDESSLAPMSDMPDSAIKSFVAMVSSNLAPDIASDPFITKTA